ncbi:MAG: hypothetical protein LAN61_04885 [Acidobacteriia bacterium]|nr:hypothetical protein [Terriglobia bacterium]
MTRSGIKLNDSTSIHVLASDLGLHLTTNPVGDIVALCHRKVKRFLTDLENCSRPSDLLSLVANKLGTIFVEIRSDADLEQVVREYADKGELAFATLPQELTDEVFGITLKLVNPGRFDLPYVSIIDCRGAKASRVYFTKWHELGHLLILTDQRRFAFKRTHTLHEYKSPEESLVDVLAGEFAYYAPMVKPFALGEISFEVIEAIRDELCPDGSLTSAIIGIAKAWPRPCILMEAALAYKKGDGNPAQTAFGFTTAPTPTLRAVNVTINEAARLQGMQMFRNFRVPEASIISKVFSADSRRGEAQENLNWWKASDGTQLTDLPVLVRARRLGESVHALVVPISVPQ